MREKRRMAAPASARTTKASTEPNPVPCSVYRSKAAHPGFSGLTTGGAEGSEHRHHRLSTIWASCCPRDRLGQDEPGRCASARIAWSRRDQIANMQARVVFNLFSMIFSSASISARRRRRRPIARWGLYDKGLLSFPERQSVICGQADCFKLS
jgi:hypothetical protein